jgi:hypothetical protein
MTSPGPGGFKIADGYVEVHGVVDRRSVIAAADAVTRGVSDQMTTGIAFANLRDGGRKMGATLGEHAGPSAARETTEGLTQWIDQGAAAGHTKAAGSRLGQLLGREAGSPFVEHVLRTVQEQVAASAGGGAGGSGGDRADIGDGRDVRGRFAGSGGSGGAGGSGSSGARGLPGATGSSGKSAEKEGRTLGDRMGRAAAGGFLDAFTGGFRGFGSLISANPAVGTAAILIGTTLAGLAAPAFGAAFAAALIGGAGLGVIGLGAFLLRDNPRVKAAAGKLGDTAKTTFTKAAEPLVGPFERALGIFDQLIKDLGPQFNQMFKDIAPAVEPLARGLSGFIREAMPGFLDLIKAAEPFLSDLENTLPRFGEQVGKFFTLIADSGPGASLFFRDFINLLGILLEAFGFMIKWLSGMYDGARTIILGLVTAFGWIADKVSKVSGLVVLDFGRMKDFIIGVGKAIRDDLDGFVSFLGRLPGRVWNGIKDIPGKIKGLFSGIGGWLQNAGSELIGGLIRGIKNAVPGLSGTLDWITNMIPDWKGPADKDAKLLEPTGEMIMGGLARGMRRGAQDIKADLTGLTNALPAAAAPTAPAARGSVTFNINGVWDFSDGQVPDRLVAALYAALDRYEKSYA